LASFNEFDQDKEDAKGNVFVNDARKSFRCWIDFKVLNCIDDFDNRGIGLFVDDP
jgi:hypothetical protein